MSMGMWMAAHRDRAMSSPAGRPPDTFPGPGPDPDAVVVVTHRPGTTAVAGLQRLWVGLSLAAALLSAAGSVVALLAAGQIYGAETSALNDAATAQDLVGLMLVAPLLSMLAVRASRGGMRAWLCWLGCLAFTVYNYAIYAFSLHFGPLFLLWVAVLGLSLFALIGGLTALPRRALTTRVDADRVRWVGWFLIAVAVLFGLLWLREIVPDLLAGRSSTSAAAWRVPTNPVHVLDLTFFLPAVFASGLALLRRRWLGAATAAGQLTFLALMCLPILVTPVVAQLSGHTPVWSVGGPVGVLLLAVALVLWRFLRAVNDAVVDPT
jgi:hypothetical protein